MIIQKIVPVTIIPNVECNAVRLTLRQYDLGSDTAVLSFEYGIAEGQIGADDEVIVLFASKLSGMWQPPAEVFDAWGVDDSVLMTGFLDGHGLTADDSGFAPPAEDEEVV